MSRLKMLTPAARTYISKNGDPGVYSAKNTTEIAAEATSEPTKEHEMTTTESMPHPIAAELNRGLIHPVWCANEVCVTHHVTGDVWHASRTVTHAWETHGNRHGENGVTITSTMLRYGVIGEDDSPACLEITIQADDSAEAALLYISPQTARELAQRLIGFADELDLATGTDGLS